MDWMPVRTAQSPDLIASVQDANATKNGRASASSRCQSHASGLLSPENAEVLRQYLNGTQTSRISPQRQSHGAIFHHPE